MFSVLPNQAILQDFLNLGSWQHQNSNSEMSQSDKAILWGQASFKNEMFCILYTICYILYSMLYLISVFQYYIRIYDISNLILRISNPASGFMFCLLIMIMIVYLFRRDCNYNYSNCSSILLILNKIKFFVFSVFLFFGVFFRFFLHCFCFFCFWIFFGCFFDLHFFTNKLIFKFIGFWLSGCQLEILSGWTTALSAARAQ